VKPSAVVRDCLCVNAGLFGFKVLGCDMPKL
jgi:hypothetical protein